MTSEYGYKVCPRCEEEYTLVVERCASCDVALVSPDELPSQDEEEQEEFPPASELVHVRVAPIPWIRALSAALEEADIPHRVEPGSRSDPPEGQTPETFGDVDLFGMYVLAEHAEATRELDSRIAAQILPEEAEDLTEGEDDACPACGATLAADDTACPDCGLGLG